MTKKLKKGIILYGHSKERIFNMQISESVKYVGVTDKKIDLFEGQYKVPNGISYNSYVILDDKIAVVDAVDINFTEEWTRNIKEILCGREPDMLVVQHMEPDHAAGIMRFAEEFPKATVVSSAKAFKMMQGFFGTDFADRQRVVKEGDELPLGKHTLKFVEAPMVHWPEVIMSYETSEGILFSADGFGKFGAPDLSDGWVDEARRYYIGIVGKYGAQVQSVLKKAAGLDIKKICPLHGPVLAENLGKYISLYDKWSKYEPEEDGITVAYTSVYGNTKKAALKLYDTLIEKGAKAELFDLARCDMAEAVASAFRFSKLVLATTTYNAGIFPHMHEFINHLTERGFKNRKVAFIENGSWAPMAEKVMRGMLEGAKDIEYIDGSIRILSAPNSDTYAKLDALCDELVK